MAEKEFDFTGAKEAGVKQDEEIKEAESQAPKVKKMTTKAKMKQRKDKGQETPEIIAEARELAGRPGGMNIEKFFKKHGLINVNIEKLLQHPLDPETGYYA